MKKILIILVCLLLANLALSDNTASTIDVEKQELLKIFEDEALVDQFLRDMENIELNRESRKFEKPVGDNRTINTEMVIITNSTLLSTFEQFAKIKNEEGIKTEVLTTSTTGSTASAIRSYLNGLKTTNSDLTYVLIGGDDSIIPTKSFNWIKDGVTKTASTDFYYSNVLSTWPGDDDIDDIVLTPDLYVGRVPVRTLSEALIFKAKYTDFRTDYTDDVDRMAFIATNIQKIPNPSADDYTIDKVIDNLGSNVTEVVLYTDDLVDTLNGCAQPVIDLLEDRDYSFLYGIWHGGDCYVIFDSEYDRDDPWYERNFGKHDQKITINEYRADYGTCWYQDVGDSAVYYYSNSADNYHLLQDEIPNSYGSSYVAWIGACYTANMDYHAYHEPVQFDAQSNVIQNYSFAGADTSLTPYYVSADPDSVDDAENCISEEFFNEIGGPIAIYATSADDYPYFSYRMVEEYMDLQFEDDFHKLGYLTRESWDRVSNWFDIRPIREMYIGYTLFGDPSMDVWSAEAEQLVTILDHGIGMGATFTALNSSGVEVDAEIVVTNSSGTILGKGDSPYTYTGLISSTSVITSNAPNYIQARDTHSVLSDYTGLPYSMNFENGIDYNWEMHSSNSYGRTLVTDLYTPHGGSKHLIMDCKTGTYTTNEAWLHLDLTDEDRVELNFWWKEFSDETHTSDGVYFSDDGGTNFTKVYSLTSGLASWQEIALDVDTLSTYYSLDYTSNFVIKFQQYDNESLTRDGFAFDDISVYSVYAYLPYYMDFENGLDDYWITESSNNYGRIQCTSENSPYEGSGHLTMDTNTASQYVTNSALLYLKLSPYNSPEISFWWKEFYDETHTTDGVYFSDDAGANFTKVYSLSGGSTTWQEIELDIADLASTYSLDLTSHFVIKFQQYDNNRISGALDQDGFAFDYICVVNDGGGSDSGINDDEIVSTGFILNNHPNPFNPTTTISFSIPEEGNVDLTIYNIKGQMLRSLLKESMESGSHSVIWNGNDEKGRTVGSGVYFYKLKVNSKTEGIKKMLLLK